MILEAKSPSNPTATWPPPPPKAARRPIIQESEEIALFREENARLRTRLAIAADSQASSAQNAIASKQALINSISIAVSLTLQLALKHATLSCCAMSIYKQLEHFSQKSKRLRMPNLLQVQ